MIEEQVRVIGIEGDQLLLQAQTQSACGGCAAKKGCGTAVLSKVVGQKFTHFQARNTIDANVGDLIVVGLTERALLNGSFVIYMLPIIGMILLALFADAMIVDDVDAWLRKDASVSLFSLLGFSIGSGFARYHFLSSSSKESYQPVVLRKLIG